MALSPHVATFLRDKGLVGWMDDTTKRLQKGIKIFPPVFPVELPPLPGMNASSGGKATDRPKARQEELAFALQGNYDSYRRNFGSVFDDLANLTSISLTPPPAPAKYKSKKPDDAKKDVTKDAKEDAKKGGKKEGAKKEDPKKKDPKKEDPKRKGPKKDSKGDAVKDTAKDVKEDAKKDPKKKISPLHEPRSPDNAVIVDSHGRPSMDSLPQRFRWDDENDVEEASDPTSPSKSSSSSSSSSRRKPNITLHLLGYGESPKIPPPLTDHVMLNPGLSYPDFYSLLSSAMAIIPAFANNQYLDRKASSSVPAALIAGTPLIADRELLDAYSYLDEDSVFMMGKGKEKKETRVEVMQRIVDMSEDERTEAKRRVRLRCASLVWQNKEMVSGDGGWIDEVMGRKSRKGSSWRWLRRLQLGKEGDG